MGYEPEWLPTGGVSASLGSAAQWVIPTSTEIFWTVIRFIGGFGRAAISGAVESIEPEWFKSPKIMSPIQQAVLVGGHLYWLTREHPGRGPWFVSRSNLAAKESEVNYETLLELGTDQARSLATDGTYLYIGFADGIGRMDLGTLAWERHWITFLKAWKGTGGYLERGPGYALVTDSEYIYWSVPEGIARAKLDASIINENFMQHSALDRIVSIAIGGEYLWIGTGGSKAKIARARRSGGGLGTVPGIVVGSKTGGTDFRVAVDATYLYWGWYSEYIARWDLASIPVEELPAGGVEKEKEEEEEGGGESKEEKEGKEKEEQEKQEKEKEGKETEEEEAEEAEEGEEGEKKEREEEREREEEEEREEKVEKEKEKVEEKEVPTPPEPVDNGPVHPGIVRYGREPE